jgi:hypothetical protein
MAKHLKCRKTEDWSLVRVPDEDDYVSLHTTIRLSAPVVDQIVTPGSA